MFVVTRRGVVVTRRGAVVNSEEVPTFTKTSFGPRGTLWARENILPGPCVNRPDD